MLTLFSIPKAFEGRSAEVQDNALSSWTALGGIEVILVGDEPGVADAARRHGVTHLPDLAANERGTPRVDDAFAQVERHASHRLRCFVNADIILLDDLLPAVATAQAFAPRSLLIGSNVDLETPGGLALHDPAVRDGIRADARARGIPRGYAALDWFVFPSGHFDPMPPFLVGRACYDNWLVWCGRQRGPVIDASRAVLAVHQSHDYSHVAGGKAEAYYGAEAKENERLAGGRAHVYTLYDASHRMTPRGVIRPYRGSCWRVRERLRSGVAKARLGLGLR